MKKKPTTLYFPEGEAAGSEGGKAQFEGRVVVVQVDSFSQENNHDKMQWSKTSLKVRDAIVLIFQEDGGSRHQAMVMESDVTGEVRFGLKGENTLREAPL